MTRYAVTVEKIPGFKESRERFVIQAEDDGAAIEAALRTTDHLGPLAVMIHVKATEVPKNVDRPYLMGYGDLINQIGDTMPTITDRIRPFTTQITRDASNGDVLAKEIIALYRMHISQPDNDCTAKLCEAAFVVWQARPERTVP